MTEQATLRNEMFSFHPSINHSFLLDFYEGDLEDIVWSMNTFCQITLKDFYKLLPIAQAHRWKEVKALAHRLKPNFKLAGLTTIYDELFSVEHKSYTDDYKKQETIQTLTSLDRQMRIVYAPLLQQEIEKLHNFLKTRG